MDYKIRRAKPYDAARVLELIKELASYERMLDQVTATVEDLQKSIEKEEIVLFVAQADEIIAYCLAYHSYSTFLCKKQIYIEDIYVTEAYRHFGIGKSFFKEIALYAKSIAASRIDFVCLDWNRNSLDFYKNKIRAKKIDEWLLHRIEGEDIDELCK